MSEPEFELLEDPVADDARRDGPPTGAGGTRVPPWNRAVAAVLLAALVAGAFAAGRLTAPRPAPERVTATAPARFDHVFSWPGFRATWLGPDATTSSDHPYTDLGVARLTKVIDPDTGGLVPATWALVQAPVSDGLVRVLAVRPLTVDGHDAVQVDLTGRQTAQVVVGAYGADQLSIDSTTVTRVTRIDVDGEVWDVWGSTHDGRPLPDANSAGDGDYARFLASVVIR